LVVFVVTSWGLPVGFERLKAATDAPATGKPPFRTVTPRTLLGVPYRNKQASIRTERLPSKRTGVEFDAG